MNTLSPNRALSVLALSALAGMTAGCASRAAAQAPQKPPAAIVVEAARPAGEQAIFRGPGSVAPAHTYRLAFEVSGRVTSVNVDLGDRVSAGEALAAIDETDYREQLGAAQARSASAEAQAQRAENGARPQELAQAQDAVASARAQVARAEAAASLARANDGRFHSLAASGDVAQQQTDTMHTAYVDAEQQVQAARAQEAAAEQNASLVEQGPRAEDRNAALAQAAAARADAALAATTLGKTVLHAPADAYVEARNVEPGNEAQPGATAFVLTDAGTPDVIVAVPEAKLAGIHPGTFATIFSTGRRITAHVTRIEPSADTASRAASVRVRGEGSELRPGAVVDVALGLHPVRGTSIAVGALLEQGGLTNVDVYDARHQTVARRTVRVLDASAERATVADLPPGTSVVVMGQHDVQPGDPVRLVQP